MYIIQRIRFPLTIDDTELYLRVDSSAHYDTQKEIIRFNGSGTISLNTYFNSFYEKYYIKNTTLRSASYLLDLAGNFSISIYREYSNHMNDLILTREFSNCSRTNRIKIDLPELCNEEHSGRIYLEIQCTSPTGIFGGGCIATDQKKNREISLAIITCTFKREKYVTKTVETILADSLLSEKMFRIFIVDNAKTLKQSDFQDSKVRLIPNRNFGGSGGFARGLIEAISEGDATHLLIMDDDIELDSESVYRIFTWHEYAKKEFAISGSMFDSENRYLLHEAGAAFRTVTQTSLKHNLRLDNASTLNKLLKEEEIDYGAFWFFSFSKDIILTAGLPLPFFIKADDIEFGLRITKLLRGQILAVPGIAVWHESFKTKNTVWDSYYYFRNTVITSSLYSISSFWKTAQVLTMYIVFQLCIYNYNRVEMVIRAVEDFLQGPAFIKNNDPENIHTEIIALSNKHKKPTSISFPPYHEEIFHKKFPKFGLIDKILTASNLNGHLFQGFLKRNYRLSIPPESSWYDYILFGRDEVIFCNGMRYYRNTIDKAAGILLFKRYLSVLVKTGLRFRSVRAKWKAAHENLASFDFWKKHLQIG